MEDMSPEEAQALAQMMRTFNEQVRKMMEKLLRGEQLSQEELNQLGQLTGLNRAEDMSYKDWYTKRMMRALRFKEVQEALKELMEMLQKMGLNKQRLDQLQQLIQANQRALEEQVNRFAGQQIAENMSEQPPDKGNLDELMDRPFRSLSDQDMDVLRKEVRRLANRLRSRIALRQKRAKTRPVGRQGHHPRQPQAWRRAHGDHPPGPPPEAQAGGHLRHQHLHALLLGADAEPGLCAAGLVTKTHAFAFIDHLEYITPDFAGKEANAAIAAVLQRLPPGYYSTDLGYCLDEYTAHYLDTVDQRTTFIMVGDGRNNHNDPRIDIMQTIAPPGAPADLDQPGAAHVVGHGRQRHAPVRPLLRQRGDGGDAGGVGGGGGSVAGAVIAIDPQCTYAAINLFSLGLARVLHVPALG